MLSIKQASELLGIPSATLRYWEKEGLLSLQRNDVNEYRQFSKEDLLSIFDVHLYRSLDFPVKQLKHRESWNLSELSQLTQTQLQSIEDKMKNLEVIKNKLEDKQLMIERLGKEFSIEEIDELPITYKFLRADYFDDGESVAKYLENPHIHGVYLNVTQDQFQFGQFTNQVSEGKIWEQGEYDTLFKGVLKISRKDQQSNIETLKSEIGNKGYVVKEIIGEYLLSASENEVFMDYYQIVLIC
ncbi:TPA: MerR family transcriptional regulator [Streptococcus suis]